MKNPILKYVFCAVVMFAAIFSLSAHSFADTLTVGSLMPFFRISSGANEILTLDNIKGKVTVLFYESKSAVEDNRKLKTALNEFYAGEPDNLKKDILKVA
ncbi:MAG: hypothetical protein NT079_06295, partial [Candidatus Omnitrophica bacterium]|nr:hypothetical protein [Candidatus Omnitrophota bacterium]